MNAIQDRSLSRIHHALLDEWKSQHKSYELYETLSLLIKMLAIVIFAAGIAVKFSVLLMAALSGLSWLLDTFIKTFQSRTESRLRDIEQAWQGAEAKAVMRFYSQWQAKRPGVKGLLSAYLYSALTPTVAAPYILLIMAALIF